MTVGSPERADVDALVSRGVYVDYDEPLVVGVPVVFGDPNLEAVVRTQLGILEPLPILTTDMALLGSL